MNYTENLPQEKCKSCLFKQNNAGTHHINCSKRNVLVNGSEHGINNGWFNFPFDFDSIWLEDCISYRNKDFKLDTLNVEEMYILLSKEINIFQKVTELGENNWTYKFLAADRFSKLDKNFINEELFPLLDKYKGLSPNQLKEEDKEPILKVLKVIFYL